MMHDSAGAPVRKCQSRWRSVWLLKVKLIKSCTDQRKNTRDRGMLKGKAAHGTDFARQRST